MLKYQEKKKELSSLILAQEQASKQAAFPKNRFALHTQGRQVPSPSQMLRKAAAVPEQA